jgi:hypothetical protein
LFAVLSFSIPNTRIDTSLKTSDITYSNKISIREEYTDISQYNNFLHFEITPTVARPEEKRDVIITLKGGFHILNEHHESVDFVNLSKTVPYTVTPEKKPFNVIDINSTYFNSIVAFIDVQTTLSELRSCELKMTSLRSPVSIMSLVWSSILAVIVSVMLITVNARRVRPSSVDQWFTIFLAGALFFIDGPWQVFQYYAVSGFSVVYDLMPQLFHAIFIVYTLLFFGARTEGEIKRIFSSVYLHGASFIYSIILIILQFTMTQGRPLAMFPIAEKGTGVYALLCVLFFIFHIMVIVALAVGFINIKVERTWSLILIIGLFVSLEIINLAVFITRMFVGAEKVGSSSAADLFYILEANLVTFIFMYINTPISMSGDQEVNDFLVTETTEVPAP